MRNQADVSSKVCFEKIGNHEAYPHSAYAAAVDAAQAAAALPIMEAAEMALIEYYWSQVQMARDFGTEHGVPKTILASLPTRQ
jgi:hypothetical protein